MENKDNGYQAFEDFEEFFQQSEQKLEYWIERAKIEFTEEIIKQLSVQKLSKGEFAKLLDAHPGFVTRLLSGKNNFELSTMVKIAKALKSEFKSHLQPQGSKTCWIDMQMVGMDSEAQNFGVWKFFDGTEVEHLTVPLTCVGNKLSVESNCRNANEAANEELALAA